MADGTIKNRIVIEGEAEYKKALAEINRALKESKSELKAVAAEYAASGNSAKGLTAQIATLEKTHAQQSEQLALMQEHLTKVTAAYGENSREAVDLRTKINNARAEMAKTAGELTQLRTRLDAAGDAMDDLTAGTGGAADGMAQVGEQARSAQDDVEELSERIADAVGQKAIEFTVGGKALSMLKDGVAEAVRFGFSEGLDGQVESGYMSALTGDDDLSQARLSVKDVIDRLWAGRMDGMETVGLVATADTILGNKAGSDPEQVAGLANYAALMQEAFGQDTQSSMERARTLVTVFGEEWNRVYDLMTKGYQDSSDGGSLLNDVIDKGANLFERMGYDADDMFSVILEAVNNEELGKDSNLTKGMENLIKLVTDGGTESKQVLSDLGIYAQDLGGKAQLGGETAAAAYALVLTRLLSIEDDALRNRLGSAIFGETVWLNCGEDLAKSLLSGFNQTLEVDGTAADAMTNLTDNLSDSWAGFTERIGQRAGEMFDPAVGAANDFLQRVNQEIDEADGKILAGIGNAITGIISDTFTVQQGVEAARTAGTSIGEAWGEGYAEGVAEYLRGPSPNVTPAPPNVDDLFDAYSDAAGSGNTELAASLQEQIDAAASKAVQDAAEGKTPLSIDDLFAARAQAAGEGDSELVAELDAQIEAFIESLSQTGTEGAAQAAQEMTDAATETIEDAEPDAQKAGESLGGAAVLGTEDGAEGMYDAGASAAQGAIDGARSGENAMYSAGKSLGGAFRRGFQEEMQIHSPSRAAMEDMAYVTEGYLTQAERDRERIAGGAAALADALREGFGRPELAMPEISGGSGGGMTAGALAQAIREELDGMAFYLDAESMSVRLEPYVSRATSDRISATAQGQSSRAKSW